MFKVTNYQGNAHQNQDEIPLHICQNAITEKTKDNECCQGCEELEQSTTFYGNAKWCTAV